MPVPNNIYVQTYLAAIGANDAALQAELEQLIDDENAVVSQKAQVLYMLHLKPALEP